MQYYLATLYNYSLNDTNFGKPKFLLKDLNYPAFANQIEKCNPFDIKFRLRLEMIVSQLGFEANKKRKAHIKFKASLILNTLLQVLRWESNL